MINDQSVLEALKQLEDVVHKSCWSMYNIRCINRIKKYVKQQQELKTKQHRKESHHA